MNFSGPSLALSSDPFLHRCEMSGGVDFKWESQVCLVIFLSEGTHGGSRDWIHYRSTAFGQFAFSVSQSDLILHHMHE